MSKYTYSYPKDIFIELPDYEYFHSPSSVDKVDPRFRGRIAIENKLKNILRSDNAKSGAYLVTGYRGVGKTSLVNKVLNSLVYKKDNSKTKIKDAPVVIRINLGHDELKEKDILKLIAKSLFENYQERVLEKWGILKFFEYVALAFSLLIIFCFTTDKSSIVNIFFSKDYALPYIFNFPPPYGFVLIVMFFISLGVLVLLKNILLETFIQVFPNDQSLKKLRNLIERIDAQLTVEKGAFFPASFNKKAGNLFSFNRRKTYPIAETKDIESELISILEFIDKKTRIFFSRFHPRFVFIFDELDKIEANQNYNITEKESIAFSTSGYSSSAELTRKRQQTTSRILANLKHFFTTARAKFVFIAGREMYDAALGDTSDRNYFLGSIFNDVIYVNSFLTEDPNPINHNKKGTTNNGSADESTNPPEIKHKSYYHTMIEEFLCQFLLPKEFQLSDKEEIKFDEKEGVYKINNGKEVSISLKTYNLYLKKIVLKESEEDRRKVILLLNQFITYLTHRSAGSPKKLTYLLESYICSNRYKIKPDGDQEPSTCLVVSKSKINDKVDLENNYFLQFDFYAQYTFGFIEYLTIPYYHNISRYVRLFNDKLMVSTTYLLDHLYKFHNFGFSWRNLEVTPEIIDVNKAPILRKLIEDIVHFLGYSHLQYVVSGLYDFKFKKKVTQEINFLSKISERESAALNFTLDESREVKEFYERKLAKLKSDYAQEGLDNFIHSKGYLQQSLGDLYFYDQEYDDASTLYRNALQQIIQYKQNDAPLEIPLRLLVIICRIMLKLGLTLERKKSYVSAFMNYQELCSLILKSTEIELKELNIKKYSEKGNSKIKNIEYPGDEYILLSDYNFRKDIFEQPLLGKSFHHFRLKSYTTESVRLLFQPFIARLYIEDKEKIGGITSNDIDSVLEEIDFLTKICDPAIEKKIRSEYYNKIGDFLFFKSQQNDYEKHSAENFYRKSLLITENLNFSCNTNGFYSLYVNIKTKRNELNFEELKVYANNLSNLGNAKFSALVYNKKTPDFKGFKELKFNVKHLSTLKEVKFASFFKKTPFIDEIKLIFNLIKDHQGITGIAKLKKRQFVTGPLGEVFLCYYFSYWLHIINDDHSKAAFQLIKVFHIIEQIKIRIDKISDELLEDVISKILESIYRTYHSSTRLEIQRMRGIFKENDYELDNNFHYYTNNLPSVGETQEILMLYYLINFRKKGKQLEKKIESCLEAFNPSKYANMNSMYGRLNFLYLKSRLNFEIYAQQFTTENGKISYKNSSNSEVNEELNELLEYLISDSIYCLTETIRVLKIFGINYITNHATYGFAFERRAWWCELFNSCIEKGNKYNMLYSKVRKLVGAEAMPNLSPQYNYEKAIAHYTQSIETHTGKYAYKKINESMYYLEDDYNDEQLHFFAAVERYKVKNRIPGKIEKMKTKLSGSKIYKLEKYHTFCFENKNE